MKRFFYLPLLLITIFLMGGSVLNAQIIVENNQSAKLGIKSPFHSNLKNAENKGLKNGLFNSSPLNESDNEGNTCKVTCIIQNDSEKFSNPSQLFVTGPESGDFAKTYYANYPERNVFNCEMPAGTYDFICPAFCRGPKETSTSGMAVIVKELVNITQDTTIYIYHADATNQYTIQTFKPNGEEVIYSNINFDEDYMPTDTLVEGNVSTTLDILYLQLKNNDNSYAMRYVAEGGYIADGGTPMSDLWLNDVSDRYKLIDFRFVIEKNDESIFFCKYETSSMADHIIKSTTNEYAKYEDKFIPTVSSTLDNDSYLFGFNVEQSINNVLNYTTGVEPLFKANGGNVVTYVDAPKSTDENVKYDMLITPTYADDILTQVESWSWYDENDEEHIETYTYYEYAMINGLPILQNLDGGFEYINRSHNTFLAPENGGDFIGYPGHPQFSYVKEQKLLDYGSSCPINSIMAQNTDGIFSTGKRLSLSCFYIGRYGEVRNADLNSLQTVIKFNDNVVYENDGTISTEDYGFSNNGQPDGVITARFENNNIKVDNLDGSNVTDIYCDQRQEDWTAPTLQMLLFKDREGNIIDRFDTAEEGTLEFAGGDFDYIFDMQTYDSWFECKPMTVEVSYSPYCTDQWLPLEVNEVPENYFMPGFGYFYRGSLQSVTNSSATGWYDLMVKLTDASGNWQQQVISPAFRIGSATPTGIEVVKSEDATEVARYTVDGRAISAPQSGVNIVKMSDGTVKKVLVK